MTDLAERVAAELRRNPYSGTRRAMPMETLSALAALVTAGETLRREVVDLAPSDNYLPTMVVNYDEKVAALAAALGVEQGAVRSSHSRIGRQAMTRDEARALCNKAVLAQLHKRTLTPEDADALIELARAGAEVAGATRMSIQHHTRQRVREAGQWRARAPGGPHVSLSEKVAEVFATCAWDRIPEKALPLIAALVVAANKAIETSGGIGIVAGSEYDAALRQLARSLGVEEGEEPRIACYSQNKGNGAPYVNPDGSLNDPLIRALLVEAARLGLLGAADITQPIVRMDDEPAVLKWAEDIADRVLGRTT